MSPSVQKLIDKAVQALREQLGENIISCCLYGSAVRGNFIEGQSDINLLIVLGTSNPAAHEAIARAIGNESLIDPFIIGRPALARTVKAFASKFVSIKRNYRVLYGTDPLAGLDVDPAQERFLCEQALRNLHLRMTYAFVVRARRKFYKRFLLRCVTPLFVQLSEVLRLQGLDVPKEFEPRIPLLEKQFNIKGDALRELLKLKMDPDHRSGESDSFWHEQVFPIVDAAVNWVNTNWRGE